MDHLVKEEEAAHCPAPPSAVGADFALPLGDDDDDAFDFGGMSSLFLDTTYTFVDTFDVLIDGWSATLEASAKRPFSELPFATLDYALSQPSSDNDEVKVELNPEPQVRPVFNTLKQTSKQKSTQANRRKRGIRTTMTEKPPRKRAKTEILKLRNEIAELQTQLSQLQDGGDGTPRNAEAPVAGQVEPSCSRTAKSLSKTAKSLDQAAVELKKLQDAQQLNCCLKLALADKIQVCKAFEAVLETQPHFQVCSSNSLQCTPCAQRLPTDYLTTGSTFIQAHSFELLQEASENPLDPQSHKSAFVQYHHQSNSLLAELEQLYLRTDCVLKEIDIPQGTGSTSSRTTSNAVYGPRFEQKSSTPIPRDSRFLSEYLWQQVTAHGKDDLGSKPTTEQRQQDPERQLTHEKRYSMMLDAPFGSVKVDCVSLIRRIVEEESGEGQSHRVVFVYTSEISVADGNYRFKEHGWLVLTPDAKIATAEPASPPSSQLQTFYQLSQDNQGLINGKVGVSSTTTDPATCERRYREYQQELAMHALTSRARARHMHIERLMRFDPL